MDERKAIEVKALMDRCVKSWSRKRPGHRLFVSGPASNGTCGQLAATKREGATDLRAGDTLVFFGHDGESAYWESDQVYPREAISLENWREVVRG